MRGSGYEFEWANTLALAAAVVAITPLAKGSVYVTGFVVEMLLLGPDPGTTYADIGLVAGLDVFIRLFVGNESSRSSPPSSATSSPTKAVHVVRRHGS